MIRVLMLDLGGTLEDGDELLPFARECLEAASRFRASDGSELQSCLVSDFLPAEPPTEAKVAEIFGEYLEILDRLGLRDLFEPVERRVTLSTHAGVSKPDRRVFALALERLGAAAKLEECLFVTENAVHVAAARDLGLAALQFGAEGPDGFTEWREGLLKIALKVDPAGQENIAIALEALGRARGVAAVCHVAVSPARITAEASALVALDDASLGELDGVLVPAPATIDVKLGSGAPRMRVATPEDARSEAMAFVRSLQAQGKVSSGERSLLGPPTHVVETDPSGRRLLKRCGFD